MTYDSWKTTNPDDQWLGPELEEVPSEECTTDLLASAEPCDTARDHPLTPDAKAELVRDNMLTEQEKAFIREMVEKRRPEIEAGMTQPQDYTQDADDVMLIQYCLALGMQDLLKREAMYANGGGWCLGRVHADIARANKLQDLYGRAFEVVMRDCGE